MISISHDTFNEAYRNLFYLFSHKELVREISPRDKLVLEIIEPVSWTITKPWNCWLTYENRKLNPFFAAAEIFWILGGKDDVEWIARFNENMRKFADKGSDRFNAGYGNRIRKYPFDYGPVDQLNAVVRRLIDDRYTRRAVIGLWHPMKDNAISNDIACNNMVYFTIRDDHLNTTVVIRSNDFIWGVPYNMLQFQHLAMLVIGEYNSHPEKEGGNIHRGTHTVVANNLHVYKELYVETLDRMDKNTIVEGFSQEFCNEPIPLSYLEKTTSHLDNYLNDIENIKFWEIKELAQAVEKSRYWEKLSIMAILHQLRKHGLCSKSDVISYCTNHLDPMFGWLADDFWGGHDGV